MITQQRLKHLLRLDVETGVFYWLNPNSPAVKVGQRAGRVANNGYVGIMLDGVRYQAHRLVWLWYTGALPKDRIDHRDGLRANNRFDNLRGATHAENAQNLGMRKDNRSGLVGANWNEKTGSWKAQIAAGGVKRHLGLFSTPADAHAAYLAAKVQLHEFQPVPRKATEL